MLHPALRKSCNAAAPVSFMVRAVMRTFHDMRGLNTKRQTPNTKKTFPREMDAHDLWLPSCAVLGAMRVNHHRWVRRPCLTGYQGQASCAARRHRDRARAKAGSTLDCSWLEEQ
jgi:hypothetical protein